MKPRQPKYSMEEHARRGMELYKQQILPQVEVGNTNKIVAIDIDTGAFEVSEDHLTACQQLLARFPDAQIWCERIGHVALYHFGFRGAITPARKFLNVVVTLRVTKPHHAERDGYNLSCRGNMSWC